LFWLAQKFGMVASGLTGQVVRSLLSLLAETFLKLNTVAGFTVSTILLQAGRFRMFLVRPVLLFTDFLLAAGAEGQGRMTPQFRVVPAGVVGVSAQFLLTPTTTRLLLVAVGPER
jgi:hypothetical protein